MTWVIDAADRDRAGASGAEALVSTIKIRASIIEVMREVKRLEKESRNEFGKYDYTSVDDFKDALRPLLTKNGLEITTDELSCELIEAEGKQKTLCAKFQYAITLRHVEGESDAPEKITVILPYTGAQTTGASRSYAIKEWLKTKFLQSSGDQSEEADQRQQDDYHSVRLPKKDARPIYEMLSKTLREAADTRDPKIILKWGIDNREKAHQMPADWEADIRRCYVEALDEAKANEAIDRDASNGAALQ